MRRIYFLIASLIVVCCNPKQHQQLHEKIPTECEDFINVTYNELSSRPFDYHQKKIRIEGYFHYLFEDVAIYESKDSNIRTAVWIEFNKRLNLTDGDYQKMSNRKIDVVGFFDAEHRGHLSQYIGELNIMCILNQSPR
jgi:hypothetical protein